MSTENTDVDECSDDNFAYKLVSFVGYTDETGQKLIDIVLASWIRYNAKNKQFETKFPPPPYDRSVKTELNTLLKSYADAPGYWSEYPIDFRGHAKTFSEAQKRLKKLQKKEYAYTSDGKIEDKIEATKKKYRDKRFKVPPEVEEKIFQVPSIAEAMKNCQEDLGGGPSRHKTKDSSESQSSDPSVSPISTRRSKRRRGNGSRSKSCDASKKSRIIYEQNILHNSSSGEQSSQNSSQSSNFSSSPVNTRKKRLEGENSVSGKEIKSGKTSRQVADEKSSENSSSTLSNSPVQVARIDLPDIQKFKAYSADQNPGPTSKTENRKLQSKYVKRTLNAKRIISDLPKSVEKIHSIPTKGALKIKENEFLDIFTPILPQKERDDPVLLHLRTIKCMHVVHLDQLETQRQLRDIEAKLASSIRNDDLPQNFADKYNLSLPISSIEDFLSMEVALKSDLSFKAEFKNSLSILMDRDNLLSRTFTNILKCYLSREVVLQFNAVKATEKKPRVFKSTEFYKCIFDFITAKYMKMSLRLTEKEFLHALGPVLTNAVDWDGYRALRTKKIKMEDIPVVVIEQNDEKLE